MSDKNNYNRKTLDLETKMKVVNKSKNVSQRKLASLFNCSKTQICRILQDKKSLSRKGDNPHGMKKSKDRIAILLCVSALGDKEIPLIYVQDV